jgi:hypothetical protein
MTEETTTQQPDPSTVLCRVVDVDTAMQNSFRRFLESEGKMLEELAGIIREELSKMELFVPNLAEPPSES